MLNSLDIMTHKQTNLHAQSAEILIEPHLEQFSTSDIKKAAELINEGYRAATLAMPSIQKYLNNTGQPAEKKPGFFGRFAGWLKGE